MPSQRLAHAKEIRDDGCIVEIVIWQLEAPIPPCRHAFKYRLHACCPDGWYVRYDNERGKGDHRHIHGRESAYAFTTLENLLRDFRDDVTQARKA